MFLLSLSVIYPGGFIIMSEYEFQQYQEHIDSLVSEYRKAINGYPHMNYNDRASQLEKIRSQYNQIRSDISEWEATSATWPSMLRKQVKQYVTSLKPEIEKLNNQFQADASESSREQLLGSAIAQEIDQNRLADELLDNANEIREVGTGILQNLGTQRKTITHFDGMLDDMNSSLSDAESLIGEMRCRDKQRKIFLYGIAVALIITILVFLYFLFK